MFQKKGFYLAYIIVLKNDGIFCPPLTFAPKFEFGSFLYHSSHTITGPWTITTASTYTTPILCLLQTRTQMLFKVCLPSIPIQNGTFWPLYSATCVFEMYERGVHRRTPP